jgi:hypothetical protein
MYSSRRGTKTKMYKMGRKKTYKRKLVLKERKAKMRRRKMQSLMIHHLMLPLVRDLISASKMRVM